MKTDDLIEMLAAGSDPVAAGTARRRFAIALGWGGIGAFGLLMLTLGINPELARMARDPMFWAKLAYTVALAGIAAAVALRLSRPGARAARVASALAVPLLAMWLLAGYTFDAATSAERDALIFGGTSGACPFNIALLSIPLFGALLWAMKGLAPTRLALAGGAAGLLSGAAASAIYCLHCPELGAPFLGLWYPLGMLIPAAVGAALGPKLLRW